MGQPIKIREIKRKLSDGSMSPETLVRYRSENDWVELGEFLDEWIKKRATIKQLDYLAVLQKQHGINAEIAVDAYGRKSLSASRLSLQRQRGLTWDHNMEWMCTAVGFILGTAASR